MPQDCATTHHKSPSSDSEVILAGTALLVDTVRVFIAKVIRPLHLRQGPLTITGHSATQSCRGENLRRNRIYTIIKNIIVLAWS